MMLRTVANLYGCRRQQFRHVIQVDQAFQIGWQAGKMQRVALVKSGTLPCKQCCYGSRIDRHNITQINLGLAPRNRPQALFQSDFGITDSKWVRRPEHDKRSTNYIKKLED
jgi:hypothetical protein